MSIPENSICPLCRIPLREYHDYVTCPTCETSYHEKCWNENKGCPVCDVIEESVDPAPPTAVSWYLFHQNRNLGPLTWEELCNQPGIQPSDMVWNKGMPDWIRADHIPDLPLGEKAPAVDEPAAEAGTEAPAVEEPPVVETAPPIPVETETEEPAPEEVVLGDEPAAEAEETKPEAGAPAVDELPAAETAPPVPAETETEEPAPEEVILGDEPAAEGKEEQNVEALAAAPGASSRTEQLLEKIYTEEKEKPTAETADPDERAKATLIHARQVIAGIMLVLGGAIAAATTYFYAPVSGTIYYLIAVGAIIFGVAGFFRGLSGWLKLKPWHSGD